MNRILQFAFSSALLGLLLATSASVMAQGPFALYAIDGNFAQDSEQTSTLYQVDANNASVRKVIGDTGERLGAIVMVPSRGELVGVTTEDSSTPSHLVSINRRTGATTPIVALNVRPDPNDDFVWEVNISSLAVLGGDRLMAFRTQPASFDPIDLFLPTSLLELSMTDGSIQTHGSSFFWPLGGSPSEGPAGIVNAVGAFSLYDIATFGCEWAWDRQNNTFWVGLRSDFWVSPFNPRLSPPPFPGLEIELGEGNCFNDGVQLDSANFLLLRTGDGRGAAPVLTRFTLLDEDNALQTDLGSLPTDIVSIARGPLPSVPVPTLSYFALILMTLMLSLVAFKGLHNRTTG